MKIIDTHAHIFPEKIASAAVSNVGGFYGIDPMAHKGTSEDLLEAGGAIGTSKYLVFSTATTPKQVESIHNFIMKECECHPEFVGAGTMHKDYENFETEIKRIKEAGMKGIKLHPDLQKFAIDDEKMMPVYEVLESLGMFVITHAGDPRYTFSNPTQVARVASSFPKMPIIAAHMGGWGVWDEARELLPRFENIFVDTCSTYSFAEAETLMKSINAFDSEKIFFATDYPMWDPKSEFEKILSLNLPEAFLEKILSTNFEKFYASM